MSSGFTLDDSLGGDPTVAAFLGELRATVKAPLAPAAPELMAVFRDGLPLAPSAAPVPARRPLGRRVATVAAGLGVALSGVAVAGAADLLPDPAQRVVASVVRTLTPFEIPSPPAPAQVDVNLEPAAARSTLPSTAATTMVPRAMPGGSPIVPGSPPATTAAAPVTMGPAPAPAPSTAAPTVPAVQPPPGPTVPTTSLPSPTLPPPPTTPSPTLPPIPPTTLPSPPTLPLG